MLLRDVGRTGSEVTRGNDPSTHPVHGHLEKHTVEKWPVILSLDALSGVNTKDLSLAIPSLECFRRVRLAD